MAVSEAIFPARARWVETAENKPRQCAGYTVNRIPHFMRTWLSQPFRMAIAFCEICRSLSTASAATA